MGTGRAIDELPRDAYPACRLTDAAFEHVTDTQLACHLLHVHGAALVGEAGIACDDEQPVIPRQSGDDVLHHAIGEILLLRVAAQVLERQHRNRWLVGEREHRSLRRWTSLAPNPMDP